MQFSLEGQKKVMPSFVQTVSGNMKVAWRKSPTRQFAPTTIIDAFRGAKAMIMRLVIRFLASNVIITTTTVLEKDRKPPVKGIAASAMILHTEQRE